MFTIQQIKEAHSKVKSGADFPQYIQDLIKVGVIGYESFVADGHTEYYGANEFKISSAAIYEQLNVSLNSNKEQFKADLKAHQSGYTDYQAFCVDCAKSGIEKWRVNMKEMTCTYFDKNKQQVLIEEIPA